MKYLLCILFISPACGLSINTRIFGGEKVEDEPGERGRFHHLALLRFSNSICSGVFIEEDWILTAAHCQPILQSTTIFAGPTTNFTSAYEYRPIKVIPHPDFNETDLNNDISLVKVESVNLSELSNDFPLSPVFPKTGDLLKQSSCYVAGYGHTSEEPHVIDGSLYFANLPLVDETTCKEHNSQIESFYGTIEYENRVCAGEIGKTDSCTGDSGGPLICSTDNNEEFVVGVTSFGPMPCGTGYGVYAKVSQYSKWIDSVVNIEEECCRTLKISSRFPELNGVYEVSENGDIFNQTESGAFVQRAEYLDRSYWLFFNTENRSTSTTRIRTNDSFQNANSTCILKEDEYVSESGSFDYQTGEISDTWTADDGSISLTCLESDPTTTVQESTTAQTFVSTTVLKSTTSTTKSSASPCFYFAFLIVLCIII
ncbi:Oidioi.mRNA.OKI2018_I69.XSR.g15898.t2.cds [Oikopleura dioica]|uniref:Oidioi.mRNA.OKI2018_I69.XSR.g15898.t2.cds n=1 Tax=Oikopleura dioica TaxID=34765 RepID=A0ABN7SE92_OIKDI|nr:Oidioi.mRNA.OKI2018_I69.XSR.g15898.t2.cds [Oikopleura dioica]